MKLLRLLGKYVSKQKATGHDCDQDKDMPGSILTDVCITSAYKRRPLVLPWTHTDAIHFLELVLDIFPVQTVKLLLLKNLKTYAEVINSGYAQDFVASKKTRQSRDGTSVLRNVMCGTSVSGISTSV